MTELVRKKILITVMTYPHPSESYNELICVAGISEDQEWIRLYPVDYRYQPFERRFRKYQWIEVDLEPNGAQNDNRLESRNPVLDSLRILGEPLSCENNWEARRKIINNMPCRTLNKLKQMHDSDNVSLGIVKPKNIIDLEITPTTSVWKPKQQAIFSQLRLFERPPKPLRKIPYEFRYVFECEDSDSPHKAMILDWELGVLFLKESDRLGSDEEAAKSVKHKFLDVLCDTFRDTRFFMGTRFPYNTWMVLGVFWPPRVLQQSLF